MKKMVLIPYDQYFHASKQEKTSPTTTTTDDEKLDKKLILEPFGKNQRRQAESLLSYVEKNISWNANGEIIINHKPVIGSHITDLLKDALFSYKNFEPCGMSEFYANLKNIPSTLIRNLNRKSLVGRGSTPSTTRLPPPGIPIGRPVIDLTRAKAKTEVKTKEVLSTDSNWIQQWKAL